LFRHAHRALRRGSDQSAHGVEHLFLLIDQLETLTQGIAIERAAIDRLETLDESLQRGCHERKPVRLHEFTPTIPAELPPARWQIASTRMVDLEEFGTECFGPQLEDAVNAVAREPRA
jgi:hypothetical protein